jgi:2-amino-4-hydroxy-6-hydroxymethyldihydropteridine diphosphokinase
MQIAYLLTGSNQGDRRKFISDALQRMERLGIIKAKSALYETAAWGKTDQAAFLNQAIALEVSLTPQDLLQQILAIEKELGRIREEKYGPRTIDIDILFFGNEIVEEVNLVIPHPQISFRRFALQCLNDIAPSLIHPQSGKSIATLLRECSDSLTVNKLQ